MKLRTLSLMLASIGFFAACASTPEPSGPRVVPTMAVRNGGGETAGAYYALGRYYQGQERYEKAENAYVKALTIDPGFVEARNALGTVQGLQGRLELAVESFSAAVREAPEVGRFHNNLGYTLLLAGRNDDAIASLRRALTLDPTDRRARENLGTALARAGQPAEEIQAAVATPADTSRLASGPGAPQRMDVPTRAEPSYQSIDGAAAEPMIVQPGSLGERIELVQLAPNMFELRPEPRSSGAIRAVIPAAPGQNAVYRLEISNGNGIPRAARRVSEILRGDSIKTSRLTNERPFRQLSTVVGYRPGFAPIAAKIAALLPVASAVTETTALSPATDVRVVIGKDVVRTAWFRDRHLPTVNLAMH